MRVHYSINHILAHPEFLNHDKCWCFWDWFCDDKALERRAKACLTKLAFLIKEKIIDGDNHYFWLKNNCPMSGSLYDDIRINTLDGDSNFLGGFCPKTGHLNVENKAAVWILPKGTLKEFTYKNWAELKKHIKSDKELRTALQRTFNPKLGEGK